MFAFIAYVAGAVFFAVAALDTTTLTHAVDWGLFAVAVGLTLDHAPTVTARRRGT